MIDSDKLSQLPQLPKLDLSEGINPVVAVVLTVLLVPIGYQIGWLYVVHLVPQSSPEAEMIAIPLTVISLMALAFLVASLQFDGSRDVLSR